MDNFYTSVPLLEELLANGMYGCCTVRANRKGLPTRLLPKNAANINKHEYRLAQKDEITYCIWRDTKPVLFLSNFHDPTEVGEVNRRSGAAQQRQVPVPMIVQDYQKNMKGVDLCDQMTGYYTLEHRSKKWWRRIFFYLMVASVHNSYIIAKDCHYAETKAKYPTFKTFVEDMAEGLVGKTRVDCAAPLENRGRLIAHHDIEKIYHKSRVCFECRQRANPTGGKMRGYAFWL